MGSKKYRNQFCVYCSRYPAVTGDHIFAREFFLPSARANLPQVPACDTCNNEKSKLEHYLTAVLPFGGKHPDAQDNLVSMVPGRLAKNVRLHRDLKAGLRTIWIWDEKLILPTITIPIDADRVCKLLAYIARALTWFHWRVYLTSEQNSDAIMLSTFGQEFFGRFFRMNAAQRVTASLGSGTVTYMGVQAIDTPQLTLWQFRMYAGIRFAGDPQAPNEVSTEIGAFTGPRRLVSQLAGRIAH